MGIFGGVQVVGILCSIVRVKLVALWIGATGVGLFGIFNTALETINSLCQLSLRNSAVRDLAASPRETLPRLICAVRRWGWALGLLGATLTLIFSGWLSEVSFHDTSHQWSFALLSVTILMSSVSAAEGAVFQGMQKYKKLAMASLWGSLGGLIVSIPLFWYLREESIVPSIAAYVTITWLALGVYRAKTDKPSPPVTLRETASLGKGFLVLGAYMTVTSFVTNLASYIFISWLNNRESTEIVGYYQAGFTIVNRYVGLVFTAIAMEYYPRLTSVIASRNRSSVFVSHETGITMMILPPLVMVFVSLAPFVINLLYKEDFLMAVPFASWAMAGTLFRAVSWCMAFTILAKGDGRTFIVTEVLSAIAFLALSMGFYIWLGLDGMGYAYCIWYAVYTLIVGAVYYLRYKLTLAPSTIRAIAYALAASFAFPLAATILSGHAWFTPYYLLPFALIASIPFLRTLLRRSF